MAIAPSERPSSTIGSLRLEKPDELWLDPRRAVWAPAVSVLAVSDLHLGYAWVQRKRGLLLPLAAPDDAIQRLEILQTHYRPKHTVILGDIVHRALSLPAITEVLTDFVRRIGCKSHLVFCLGNHDINLEKMVKKDNLAVEVVESWSTGPWQWIHGDQSVLPQELVLKSTEPCTIMGHEHPCVRLGDGIASAVKAPCFLVSDRLVVLPAFSEWASGTTIGSVPFMSQQAQAANFEAVYVCMGNRILRLPWTTAVQLNQRVR